MIHLEICVAVRALHLRGVRASFLAVHHCKPCTLAPPSSHPEKMHFPHKDTLDEDVPFVVGCIWCIGQPVDWPRTQGQGTEVLKIVRLKVRERVSHWRYLTIKGKKGLTRAFTYVSSIALKAV